jgi:glycosyltransferase involved in cell wall biosynthesis
VDTARFGLASSAEARRALGLPPDRRILLSVGTLSPRKGHQRVIDVLPHIRATHPDLLYVVLGGPGVEGDTGPLLERLIAQHGLRDHVRLLGAQPHEEVPRWLAAADLFCLATTNEGRANVILEALACGVPVVTTDVGGSREVIADGMDGLLVAPGDPAALTAALLRALSMGWDREAIARRAAGRSWEQTVDDLSEELGALAGAPTPAFTDASPGSPRR